jgi:riboflavin synthase
VFTGITKGLYEVVAVNRAPSLLRYTVELGELARGLELGASVSVDGVCQTAMAIDGTRVSFEAVAETLSRTTLDELELGRRVSIERSLRAGDEIGGHEVSGHVAGTAVVAARETAPGRFTLLLEVPMEWGKYLMPKGFVAVDGSSLTLGEVERSVDAVSFRIHLIPETLRLTGLGSKQPGDRVNIELDARTVAIVETVERVLAQGVGIGPR